MLMAQEDYDTVLRLHPDGKTDVAVANAKGLGALSIDHQGRLWGAHRTERPGSTKPDRDQILNAIRILTPAQQVIGQIWDGHANAERPNDIIADNNGGAYFTAVCLYYRLAQGRDDGGGREASSTNGINLSPDLARPSTSLNGPATIVAFGVKGPGVLENPPRLRPSGRPASGAGDRPGHVDSDGRRSTSVPALACRCSTEPGNTSA